MRLIKILCVILCIFLYGSSILYSNEILEKTSTYYKDHRTASEFQEYYDASVRVGNYMSMDPVEIFSWGQIETHHKNLICFNIPEWKYINGKVKRFSVDMGFVGINSKNWVSVYKTAKIMQTDGLIPDTLQLFKFPNVKQWEVQYKKYGPDRKRFKDIKFDCDKDCIESMLVYRVIIERDRGKFNWDRKFEQYLRRKNATKHRALAEKWEQPSEDVCQMGRGRDIRGLQNS
jgi:hypothetical protein